MKTPLRFIRLVLLTIFACACASTKTASYHYANKQISQGDLSFADHLRVDEYINSFPQDELPKPKAGEPLALSVSYFQGEVPKPTRATLAQVAVRTRDLNAEEKKAKYGLSIVFDVSGSMLEDNKFQDSIEALLSMVDELRDGTEFALVTFSSEADVSYPPTVVDATNREKIKAHIRALRPGGGTNIQDGLIIGYKTMGAFSKNLVSRLVLLTDGRSNVGATRPEDLAKEAKSRYIEGARISTIGIGRDVDEAVLRKIADDGKGMYYFADHAKTLTRFLRDELNSFMVPVAKDVEVTLSAGSGFKLIRVYGYESIAADPNGEIRIPVGELNVDDWRVFVVEIEGPERSLREARPILARVRYNSLASSPSKKPRSISETAPLAWRTQEKATIAAVRPSVARNAIAFGDALALIEVSKLAHQAKYQEAEQILSIQIANIEAARSIDSSPALKLESEKLIKVREIVRARLPAPSTAAPLATVGESQPSLWKTLVRSALSLAKEAVPGPWSFALGLFATMLDE